MDSNHLKPEVAPGFASLSVPNTPTLMSTRRGSSVQMSAKLAALRGENNDPPKVLHNEGANTYCKKKKDVRFMQKNGRCNIKQVRIDSAFFDIEIRL